MCICWEDSADRSPVEESPTVGESTVCPWMAVKSTL